MKIPWASGSRSDSECPFAERASVVRSAPTSLADLAQGAPLFSDEDSASVVDEPFDSNPNIGGVVVLVGGPSFPAWIAGIALAFVGLGVAIGWARYGRQTVPFRYLLVVPLYVIWKIPLYASFLVGRRERQWRRTER